MVTKAWDTNTYTNVPQLRPWEVTKKFVEYTSFTRGQMINTGQQHETSTSGFRKTIYFHQEIADSDPFLSFYEKKV